ncbi:hypothetical protein [Nocardiopsis sp. FR26]|uniref:hypothetical protein n=1 Tax=Nocardiopsis sp. FR26 TaxID=2605987 RepID=UPI00135B4F82|nr:hypothetical protein [Nocardiopsis sp. FR26]
MPLELYFVYTRTRNSLGDPAHALFAHPCGPSTPTQGQLIHSDSPDGGRGYYGVLLWTDDGVLQLVGVQPRWRRKGTATALWRQACEFSGLPLDKAPARTALGEAWFQSLDIDAPLEVLNVPVTTQDEATGATARQLALDDKEATARRIVELLGKDPKEVLPYILALCAPTYEDAEEQIHRLRAERP